MQFVRKIQVHDGKLLLLGAGLASALYVSENDCSTATGLSSVRTAKTPLTTECEQTSPRAVYPSEALPSSRPSWMRRSLASLKIASLPIPRLLVKGDPAFRMDPRLLKRRQEDEAKMQRLIQGAIQAQERSPKALQDLNDKCLELAYGEGITLKYRQDFVHRHGCTAWTDEVLDAIVELGKERGVVEIGAGNGQWARALMDRYKENAAGQDLYRGKKFDFVLAYDDQSDLPLDQTVFNKKTKIHNDYFYDKVQRCGADFSNTLRKFECRGRILLLVYPPPGPMAVQAVDQYVSASPMNDTVIFVGEGRGGANANEELFDRFENGEWVLMKVIDVVPLGSKGYEHLYVLKRRARASS